MWNPETYRDTDYGLDEGEKFEPDLIENDELEISTADPHIMTILGPILPEELGVCLPHVHLLCNPLGQPDDYQLTNSDMAEAEIEAFVTMNGRGLVECSTRDAGRMIPELLDIAGWVPAHIISVTGRHSQYFAAGMERASDIDFLTEEFLRDLTVGMDGTNALSGIIKVGTSLDQIVEAERCAIQAAGRAHRRTGAPVTSHTENGTMALELLEMLELEGVASSRVTIGHLDTVPMNMDALTEIARTGAYLQFDQIGKSETYTDQQRAELIARLCEAGFSDQLLLSLDYGRKSLLSAYGGAPGLSYLSEWFMVLLMESGLEAQQVRRIVVDNPARALTIHPLATA